MQQATRQIQTQSTGVAIALSVAARIALSLSAIASCDRGQSYAVEVLLSPVAAEFFENRIRPVLADHCYECHSTQTAAPKGNLRLDSAKSLLAGGQSGPIVVPGKPEDSLLISALNYHSYEMPPQGKLPEAVIADFEKWVAMGAPYPSAGEGVESDAHDAERPAKDPRDHWSLKKPQKPSAPKILGRDWTRTVIDAFVLKRLEDAALHPSVDANPRVLLRRLFFDLTGLPPTAEELDQFADRASDAEYEQAVDRLLASPRFGERWGRHWLDIARYADTKGYVFQEDRNYSFAYKYRDWVIAAFNADMSFDRFVINQIAADQTGDASAAPAQGFLTLGRRFLNAAPDINDDRIDLVCRGLMGLTVACARCHDHKYDAIPTTDYYSLYGVLASSTEIPQDENPAKIVDAPSPVEPHVFLRGNPSAIGPQVPRRFLACLSESEAPPFKHGSGRLELAQAIANRDNPLTARVWVNRVWAKLFGRGLVTTPSDFGVRGDAPSHPDLLDWLATTFMDDSWSTKRLIRRIVLSSVYRQASDPRQDVSDLDPNNSLLARMNRRRLDLEAARDGLLAAAARLDLTMGGPSVHVTETPFPVRRSVYGFVERQNLPAFFRTFDFANPNTPAASRPQTASPHQALFMMNSPFALEQSRRLSERSQIAAENWPPPSDTERITRLYRFTLGRAPTNEEVAEAVTFVTSGQESDDAAQFAALPRWQYGWGRYNSFSDRVEFQPFPYFTNGTWQGGETLPDATLGWAMLNVEGGHPGDATHQVIRRWTAPAAGTLHVVGQLVHPSKHGNGVAARMVAASRGRVGEWTAAHGEVATEIKAIAVAAGETVDFAVDSQEDVSFDGFTWRTTLRLDRAAGGVEAWSSHDGAASDGVTPLDRWAQLAQVLLMSNEFMFVD